MEMENRSLLLTSPLEDARRASFVSLLRLALVAATLQGLFTVVLLQLIRPDRTKYCKLCERLVVDLDHHCLFIGNCVARHNHRDFVLLIANVMILQVRSSLSRDLLDCVSVCYYNALRI